MKKILICIIILFSTFSIVNAEDIDLNGTIYNENDVVDILHQDSGFFVYTKYVFSDGNELTLIVISGNLLVIELVDMDNNTISSNSFNPLIPGAPLLEILNYPITDLNTFYNDINDRVITNQSDIADLIENSTGNIERTSGLYSSDSITIDGITYIIDSDSLEQFIDNNPDFKINPDGSISRIIIVPEYMEAKKKDSKADKFVNHITDGWKKINSTGDITRLIDKHGRVYIQIPVSETIKIQYKNERGSEYTGILWTKSF